MSGIDNTQVEAELLEARRRLGLPLRPITESESRFPGVTLAEFENEAREPQRAAALRQPPTVREQRTAALGLARDYLAAGQLDACRKSLELVEACGGIDVADGLRDLERRTPTGLIGAEMAIEAAIQQDRRANGEG